VRTSDLSGIIFDISGVDIDIGGINDHLDTVDAEITQLQNADITTSLITSSIQNSIQTQPAGTFIDPPVEIDASGNFLVLNTLTTISPDGTRVGNIQALDSNVLNFSGSGSYAFDRRVDIDGDVYIASLDLKNASRHVTLINDGTNFNFAGANAYVFDQSVVLKNGSSNISFGNDGTNLSISGAGQYYLYDNKIAVLNNGFNALSGGGYAMQPTNNSFQASINATVDGSNSNMNFSAATQYVFDNPVIIQSKQAQVCNEGSVRPSAPVAGQMFIDDTLSPIRPIWYISSGNWIDSAGTVVA
jgi:hypothetical protein